MRGPRVAVAALFACALCACGARTDLLEPAATDSPDADTAPPAAPTPRDPALDDAPLLPAPHDALCAEVAPGAPTLVAFDARPRIERADVVFAIDRTDSMGGELAHLEAALRGTILPGIASTLDDAAVGVVAFTDLPVLPYGDPSGDVTLTLVEAATHDTPALSAAVAALRIHGGGDEPEASTEALYQLATGEGYAPFVPSRPECAVPERQGYACVRPDAQVVYVVVTDAPSHMGPRPAFDYDPARLARRGAARAPHGYAETLAALHAAGARVVGIDTSGGTGHGTDLAAFAAATGALGRSGEPLVFDTAADGSGLDGRVVDAVRAVVHQARLDVSATVSDLDPAHPARALVRGVQTRGGSPAANVERADASTFYGVLPGTELTFALLVDASGVAPGDAPQRFPARVEFLDDGRPGLGYRDVTLVVPSRDGRGCDAH